MCNIYIDIFRYISIFIKICISSKFNISPFLSVYSQFAMAATLFSRLVEGLGWKGPPHFGFECPRGHGSHGKETWQQHVAQTKLIKYINKMFDCTLAWAFLLLLLGKHTDRHIHIASCQSRSIHLAWPFAWQAGIDVSASMSDPAEKVVASISR